jgi:hypothetical protein
MQAIRTVREDDDVHVIEGWGIPFVGPFGGFDTYRTSAKPTTNFHWDLFPDALPGSGDDPQYTRPVTYQHGFDSEIGLCRIGGWTPVRVDKKRGVWVQAQLDKHDEYYAAIRELMDKDALGFSSGSVEHAARIDDKTGDWIDWPAWDLALTPTPSNPWATIAARTAAFGEAMVIRVTGLRATNKAGKAVGPPEGGKEREEIPAEDFAGPDKSYPIVNQASVDDAASLVGKADDPDAVKAKIIAIAKRKGFDIPEAWKEPARSAFRTAADDVAWASHVQSDLAYLMGCEASESDQLSILQEAADALARFIAAETEEIGTDDDQPVPAAPIPPGMEWPGAYMSATREGRRNATADLAHIDALHDLSDALHDHTVALGASAHAGEVAPDDESHQGGDAGRTAAALPSIRVTGLERPNAKALRKALRKAARTGKAIGAETGRSEALRVLTP